MILVTGAAGKTGCVIIRALAARGAAVRAVVRRVEQERTVRQAGASEAQVGNLEDPADVARAMNGAAAVYHICPNMHADEVRIGQIAIAAAHAAGVSHFVYHSVLHPQTAKMAHHWHKLRVEEQIFESGLAYTILQPAAYMQNLLANWTTIVNKGLMEMPYPVATRISLVDLDDVAQVAGTVTGNPDHFYATYELVGTEPLSQSTVARRLGQLLGRPVQAAEIALYAWQQARRPGELSIYATEALLDMFRYYAQFGLEGNPRALAHLLGREPTTLEQFVGRISR